MLCNQGQGQAGDRKDVPSRVRMRDTGKARLKKLWRIYCQAAFSPRISPSKTCS